jgi:hypothetical protein
MIACLYVMHVFRCLCLEPTFFKRLFGQFRAAGRHLRYSNHQIWHGSDALSPVDLFSRLLPI